MIVTQLIAGLEQASGGPSYSVPALCSALSRLGVDARLRFVGDDYSYFRHANLNVVPKSHLANYGVGGRLRGSQTLLKALFEDAREGALLHTHGLWLMPNLYPARIKRSSPSTVVVHSPRGMLAPAAMEVSKWRKSIVWRLCQRSAIQYADCIHATAQSEYEEIRAVGLKNPVAIVPNGIDPPDLPDKPPERGVARRRTILALGRIHRKKALEVLILAWAKLESHYPDWRVRIIGPAECGHDNELKRLAQAHELERLTIEGPVYGNEKFAIYSDADLFVLPTRNENFGNVVAEALASAVPVISTKGAPWSALELERCGWWIDHGVDPMAQALVTAMNTDAYQLAQMGQRGRAWMKRDFGWERVAQDMCAVYAWLRQEGSMPPTVRLT